MFHPELRASRALDSAVLIAPLVFFVAPNDPRFTNTLDRILLPLERGGLTSVGMVYRYNTLLSDDGKSYILPSSYYGCCSPLTGPQALVETKGPFQCAPSAWSKL